MEQHIRAIQIVKNQIIDLMLLLSQKKLNEITAQKKTIDDMRKLIKNSPY
jgi:hypothetical protein